MKLLQRLKNLFLPEGKISDGFHSFDELYHYRMLYNAAFFNSLEGKYEVHKSYRHADGELCFGGGWFIVMAYLPTGQISNHYRIEDWNLFNIPERWKADEWDGLNSNQIQELLFQEKGINWNDYPTKFKRGSCCIKKYHQTMNQTLRSYWFIDNEIPIFKGEDREYIEKLIA
jgi:hypothetical protein